MFTVSLPAELKNAYALRDTYVNWIFSVQGAEEVEESQDGPAIEQMAAPKTGLENPAVTVPLLLAAVTGIGTVYLYRRKEGSKHEVET